MAKTKKNEKKMPSGNRINKSHHSFNPDRASGGQNVRNRSTINRLLMYRNFKAKRDAAGKIIKPAPFQSRINSGTMARVEPNRKWFGNTRVIGQTVLQTFQEEMKKVKSNPYSMVMRPTKLPISLLNEVQKHKRVHILDTESYESTFGPKAQRKRPKLNASDMQSIVEKAEESFNSYERGNDLDLVADDPGYTNEAPELIFRAGRSKRVWGELYKVIDSADVLAQVLDARDPMGTRSKTVESYLKKEKPHKQLIFILNKCDLLPPAVVKKWVAVLSPEYPTMAFRANTQNPFGKGALIKLLSQFKQLHKDKKQISVGFVGYPNVGKSSIINTLKGKKVCNVAPIAGETKVWQYVTLSRKVYLIDCPGVVPPDSNDTETDKVLKGVVRIENIRSPEDHIPAVLERVKVEYLENAYRISDWNDHEEFLEKIAFRSGRLLKGGQPDIGTVARMVLNDWQRGNIPYYVRPPRLDEENRKENNQAETVDDKNDDSAIAQSPGETAVVDTSINNAEDEDDGLKSVEVTSQSIGDAEEEAECASTEVGRSVKITADDAKPSLSKTSDRQTKKKQGRGKKRRHQKMSDDEDVAENVKGKKKRQMYAQSKVKKIGKHFYDVANVKNRRNRLPVIQAVTEDD